MEIGKDMLLREKTRILFVISYLDTGGAERALAEITKNLPNDWEIDILVNSKRRVDFDYRGNLLDLKIDEEPKMLSIFFHVKILCKRIAALRRLKKHGGYNACISFLDSANVANILTGNAYCKTIISIRNSLMKQAKLPQYKYIVNPLAKRLYSRADWIVAVSKGVRMELVEQFKLPEEKVVAIENGYDIKRINALAEMELDAEETEFIKDKKVVITVGRLTDQKGQWHLLRAFSEVVKKLNNIVLIIVGGGELEEYLKNVAKKLKIEEKVLFVGHSNNPYKYLRRSDVFVLPSLYEGFPNAMAEAICMGLPCVATAFRTGACELLEPLSDESILNVCEVSKLEYGIISPCCSGNKLFDEPLESEEMELAKAICELFEDASLRTHYAEMSKKRRVDLGIDSIVTKYEGIIAG